LTGREREKAREEEEKQKMENGKWMLWFDGKRCGLKATAAHYCLKIFAILVSRQALQSSGNCSALLLEDLCCSLKATVGKSRWGFKGIVTILILFLSLLSPPFLVP